MLGRESFAASLDLLMCRRGVLPMDGSAYRRLDRVDAVVVDGDALCTGPPVVIEAHGEADGWDDAAVWTAAARLLGTVGAAPPTSRRRQRRRDRRLRLGPPRESPDAPGGEVRMPARGPPPGRRR